MFAVINLSTKRQVVVGNSVADSLALVRPVPLTATTRARGESVIAATLAVSLYANTRPVQVDRATDIVVAGLDRALDGQERCLHNTLLPLTDEQRVAAERARRVRARLFPHGLAFLRSSMTLQWGDLVTFRGRMQEPDIAAAIDGLGLRPMADHVLAHIAIYGRVIGKDGGEVGAGEAKANAAWTEAFRLFSAQVLIDYEHDQAMQDELLGTYRTQLADQRALARVYDRRKPAPAADAPAPAADAPAPAVAAPAPAVDAPPPASVA